MYPLTSLRVVLEVLEGGGDGGVGAWAPSRFSSTSRSPGTPIARISCVPSGAVTVTRTF